MAASRAKSDPVAQQILAILWADALSEDRGRTVKELAAETGASEAVVRRRVQDPKSGGALLGLAQDLEYRATYSTSYPGMQHGTTRAWAFRISRAQLIERVREGGAA